MSGSLKWYAADITASPEASEAIEFAFNSLDALGTESHYFRRNDSDSVHVVGYFNERLDDERVQDEVHYALRSYGLDDEAVQLIEWREVENADWLHEWKKHWKPTMVGRFVIAPPWEDVDGDGKIVVKIEPNMAFGTGTHETTQLCLKAIEEHYTPGDSFLDVGTGTGTHETTQLCLKAIEEHYTPGDSFLDVGTGTGILAIAAAKLFYAEVAEGSSLETQSAISADSALEIIGYDTDADSVKLAKENAAMNSVADLIEFAEGPLAEDSPVYDFVCANLTIDVILPILTLLLSKSRKSLVLSGILAEQRPQIEAALRDGGRENFDVRTAGEWIAVVL